MVRIAVLAWMAFSLGASAAFAQNENWANKLFLEKGGVTSHDFGTVARGAELFHRFPMTNIYQVPLNLVDVRVSCGCVKAVPTVNVLQPRQQGFLDVTMDGRRFAGAKTVTIYVTVGPQWVSTATLTVSANSRVDVVFNPGQMSFGVVPRGQTMERIVDVEYAGTLDWHVTEVATNGAPLDTSLEELYRQPGRVGYRVKASLRADAPAGQVKQELVLKTNDPAAPAVPLTVEATVQALLTAVPSTVSMGSAKVGETVTRRVVVRSNKPFRITSIDGLGDGMDADLPGNPAAVQIVTIKYQPPKVGELKRHLHIKTDLDGQTPVDVTVEGSGSP